MMVTWHLFVSLFYLLALRPVCSDITLRQATDFWLYVAPTTRMMTFLKVESVCVSFRKYEFESWFPYMANSIPGPFRTLFEPQFSQLQNGGNSSACPKSGIWKALHKCKELLFTINTAVRDHHWRVQINLNLYCLPEIWSTWTLWHFKIHPWRILF